MFNAITYSKTAEVLKMMYHVIGDAPWREFLVSFVAKHKFSNVDTNDFFDALEKIISHDAVLKPHNFKDIFSPWFNKISQRFISGMISSFMPYDSYDMNYAA